MQSSWKVVWADRIISEKVVVQNNIPASLSPTSPRNPINHSFSCFILQSPVWWDSIRTGNFLLLLSSHLFISVRSGAITWHFIKKELWLPMCRKLFPKEKSTLCFCWCSSHYFSNAFNAFAIALNSEFRTKRKFEANFNCSCWSSTKIWCDSFEESTSVLASCVIYIRRLIVPNKLSLSHRRKWFRLSVLGFSYLTRNHT